MKAAVQEVADYLGNTPTIAKNSYIDPRVFDLYESGTTIDPAILTRHRSPAKRSEPWRRRSWTCSAELGWRFPRSRGKPALPVRCKAREVTAFVREVVS